MTTAVCVVECSSVCRAKKKKKRDESDVIRCAKQIVQLHGSERRDLTNNLSDNQATTD